MDNGSEVQIEIIKKSLAWGVFFGGSIAAIIILLEKVVRK